MEKARKVFYKKNSTLLKSVAAATLGILCLSPANVAKADNVSAAHAGNKVQLKAECPNAHKQVANHDYSPSGRLSSVIAHYHDESGNTIAPDETIVGHVGIAYGTKKKAISGYTFKEVEGPAEGYFTDSPQTVTYIYTKGQGTEDNNQGTENNPTDNPESSNGGNQSGEQDPMGGSTSQGSPSHEGTKGNSKGNPAAADKKKGLPQTGIDSKSGMQLLMVGAATLIAFLAGIFGISKKRQ